MTFRLQLKSPLLFRPGPLKIQRACCMPKVNHTFENLNRWTLCTVSRGVRALQPFFLLFHPIRTCLSGKVACSYSPTFEHVHAWQSKLSRSFRWEAGFPAVHQNKSELVGDWTSFKVRWWKKSTRKHAIETWKCPNSTWGVCKNFAKVLAQERTVQTLLVKNQKYLKDWRGRSLLVRHKEQFWKKSPTARSRFEPATAAPTERKKKRDSKKCV